MTCARSTLSAEPVIFFHENTMDLPRRCSCIARRTASAIASLLGTLSAVSDRRRGQQPSCVVEQGALLTLRYPHTVAVTLPTLTPARARIDPGIRLVVGMALWAGGLDCVL